MKNMLDLTVWLLLILFSLTKSKTKQTDTTKIPDYPWEIRERLADSLLQNGKVEMALELYYKSLNLNPNRSYSLIYPVLKKVADIYFERQEYQKAIYFYREYLFLAKQQIDVDKGRGGIPQEGEWWKNSSDEAKSLEKDYAEVDALFKKLEGKYLGIKH